MPQAIEYLVKLSISLAVVYLFYQVLLRPLTFYNWNRFYLLLYSAISFAIPFVDVGPVLSRQDWNQAELIHWIPVMGAGTPAPAGASNTVASLSTENLLTIFIFAGMLLMLARMLMQLVSFLKMKKKARLVGQGPVRVYLVDEQIIPFSFGRSVFVNPALHGEEELKNIIEHEFVHARQRHTVDIIWSELLCVLNWYNPFAWLIRRAIRQNLEFIADRQVLNHGVDRRQYQYLLLKVIGNRQFSIAPQFNFSSLKKRIAMMNKMRSAGLHLLKFLFLLPILCVLLLSFRNRSGLASARATVPVTDTVKPPAPPVPPLPANVKPAVAPIPPQAPVPPGHLPAHAPVPKVATGLKNASLVKEFEITRGKATMKMKDGSVEEYDLTDPKQRNRFELKYGRIYETSAAAPTVYAVSGVDGATAITVPPGDAVLNQPARIITGGEDIVITITRSTTREQLDALIGQMKAKGVELKFSNMDFNDGELRSLSGTMKKKGSTSNFSVTDLEILVLAMTEKDGQVWFKVSTQQPDRVI